VDNNWGADILSADNRQISIDHLMTLGVARLAPAADAPTRITPATQHDGGHEVLVTVAARRGAGAGHPDAITAFGAQTLKNGCQGFYRLRLPGAGPHFTTWPARSAYPARISRPAGAGAIYFSMRSRRPAFKAAPAQRLAELPI